MGQIEGWAEGEAAGGKVLLAEAGYVAGELAEAAPVLLTRGDGGEGGGGDGVLGGDPEGEGVCEGEWGGVIDDVAGEGG